MPLDLIRVGLNPDQVADYALPEDPDALKATDPNLRAFRHQYGDAAPVELDALHPRDLQQIIRTALESVYDMTGVWEQRKQEREDRATLKVARQRIEDVMRREFPELMMVP